MVYIQREIEKDIDKWINDREIIAIRGARQSGKTTILNKTKDKLIASGVNEKDVQYFSFEDDLLRIQFEENCLEFINHNKSNNKTYFLLDEIQYIKEVGKKIKLIFDSIENIKLIVTGSSSFDLTNLGKYLVGRVIFLDLYPFSFQEFLKSKEEKYENLYQKIKIDFKNPIIEKTVIINDLNLLLKEYLTYGSYPRIVLEKNTEKKKELLKNFFTTYIEKDLVSLYGNRHRDNIIKILKILSSSNSIIKYESLSSDSGLNYHEIKQILSLLKDSFAISIINPFYKNLTSELKKNPKVYFIDYGIRNYLFGIDNINFDILYENFIHNELSRNHNIKYWRTTAKTEIDFIIDDLIPLEVKTHDKITRALLSYIKQYKPRFAFVANQNNIRKREFQSCTIFVLPFIYF